MHELHIYDLNRALPSDHLNLPKPSAEGDFNVRSVERGSRLVTCCGSSLVMQMPRGNLEGIQPRIILCKHLVELIKDKQYGKAFRLLRQHKVDINMIYDVDPEQFLNNIDLFVSQVKQVDYLNLFVNSLNNDSRGRELKFMFPDKPEDQISEKHQTDTLKYCVDKRVQVDAASKVNTICSALKESLSKVN